MPPFRFLSLSALPEGEDQQKLLDLVVLYNKPTGEGASEAFHNWDKFLSAFTESCLGEEVRKEVQLKHGTILGGGNARILRNIWDHYIMFLSRHELRHRSLAHQSFFSDC